MSEPPSSRLAVTAVVLLLAGGVLIGLLWWREPSESPPPAEPPLQRLPGFRDEAQDAGLDFRMQFLTDEQGRNFKINLYDHGCGLAIGDYDGDGWDDLYLLNQLGPNGLFRNRGDGTFEDVTQALGVGLEDRVSVAATFSDYDNDGDQDLYVTSTRGGNVLFRNEGQAGFVDVTAEAGLENVGHSQTAAFFDYNNDSLLDLYLVQTAEWTTSIYNTASKYFVGQDLARGEFLSVTENPLEYNRLYRNEGNGKFTDVTESAKLGGRGWSGDVAVFDYDQDGWQDVLVVCMFGRDQLYHNRRDGTFEDVTLEVLGPTPWGGIGAKVFDFNNDGNLDILVVDMHSDMWMGLDADHRSLETALASEYDRFSSPLGPALEEELQDLSRRQQIEDALGYSSDEVIFGNAFYQGLGDGKFQTVTDACQLETFWPWGIASGDFDNDRNQDVFIASGMGYPFYYWKNYLMMNEDGRNFVERSAVYGVEPPAGGKFLNETMYSQPMTRSSRCAVTSDLDGDGRLEIITNNFNDRPYLFRNEFPARNYLALRLQGTTSNRDAIGAVATIRHNGEVLRRQVEAAGGYLSHSSKTLHFGLGQQDAVEQVEIIWPSGQRQNLTAPAINQLHTIVEPEAADATDSSAPTTP